MKRVLSYMTVILCAASTVTVWAANSVVVTSKSVAGGEAGIDIPILLANDVTVRTIVVPLALRTVTGGAFATSLAMSYADRLPIGGPLSDFIGRNQYATEDGNCKALTPGGFGTIAFTDGAPHPVIASPEGAMLTRVSFYGGNLDPGADVTGSMILTVDVNLMEGQFEIDTTCTNPSNHLLYVLPDNTGVVPAFTKGVITIGSPPGNYPPVVHDDTYSVFGTTPLNVPAPGVLGNDTDADGDPLAAELVADVSHGTLTLDGSGSFSYIAEFGFAGTDQFTYRAYDGSEYSKQSATVTINVLPFGPNAPEAVDDSYTVILGFALDIPAPGILANDTDPNGDALSAILNEGPFYGTLSLNSDGSFRYVPTPVFSGVDRFTYYAFDGVLRSPNPATVRITVSSNTGRPIANDDVYLLEPPGHLVVPAPGVLANDIEPFGLTLYAVLDEDVSAGVLELRGNGSFEYTAGPAFIGSDEFTYHVSTGISFSTPATVRIIGFYGEGPPPTVVHFDIKPGSCPNPLNANVPGRGHSGVIPVAILGTADFDVTSIVLPSVRLSGCPPLRSSLEDVAGMLAGLPDGSCECAASGPDGYTDLTLKFDKGEIVDAIGPVETGEEITLGITGLLSDGSEFHGIDCVKIVGLQVERIKTGNHPNPFNAATTITYALTEAAKVRLQVFDLLGRRVVTLVDEYRPEGTHEIVWNGKSQTGQSVASGVYFYRLQANNESVTRKIILLK